MTGAFWLRSSGSRFACASAREAVHGNTRYQPSTRLFRIWLCLRRASVCGRCTILWLMLKRPGIVL